MRTETTRSRPEALRVTLIFEFPPADDWMTKSLAAHLEKTWPGFQMKGINGLFGVYRPGGLRPQRLANLAWVYLRTAFHLVISRPDAVIVRSSPPGIQIWTQWWSRLKGVPTICWLMDYHPEMEARALERHGWPGLAQRLRRVDADAMRRFTLIVTLDQAMAKVARERAGPVTVLVHPTWGMSAGTGGSPPSAPPIPGDPLRLAYSGNLGAAHDLEVFGRFLAACREWGPVELYVIGASPAGTARFRDLAATTGTTVIPNDRVAFSELPVLYRRWGIVAGVVLLAEASAGLVSPSKFSGYIDFGLPIVYIGPPDTNTAEVCTQFQAGFWLTNQASAAEVHRAAVSVLDPVQRRAAALRAVQASHYFKGFDGESLARQMAPHLKSARAR